MKNKSQKSKYRTERWGPRLRKQGSAERARKGLTPEQVQELRAQLCTAYGREPHDFQLEGIKAQIEGRDVLVQASTGAGKTTIAAGPHVWIKDGVTLIATPLIQLAEEMVRPSTTQYY